MKFMKKFTLIFTFSLILATVFADDYYVCLGSFKEEKYYSAFTEKLKNAGFDTIVVEADTKIGKTNRILLDEKYPSMDAAHERILALKKDPRTRKLGITGIWPLKLEKNAAPVAPQKTQVVSKKTPVEIPVIEPEFPSVIAAVEPVSEPVPEVAVPVAAAPVIEASVKAEQAPVEEFAKPENPATVEENTKPETPAPVQENTKPETPAAVEETVKTEAAAKVEEPTKTEESVKTEEPAKAEEPAKVEEPVKAEETAKTEEKPAAIEEKAPAQEPAPAAETPAPVPAPAPVPVAEPAKEEKKAAPSIKFPSMKSSHDEYEEIALLTPDAKNKAFFAVRKLRSDNVTYELMTFTTKGEVFSKIVFRKTNGAKTYEMVTELGTEPVKTGKPVTIELLYSGDLAPYTKVVFDWNKKRSEYTINESFVEKYSGDFVKLSSASAAK